MQQRNETAHARNLQLIETWRDGLEVRGEDPGAKIRRRRSERALAALLEENSPLVWRIVRQRRWVNLDEEDLYAAGMTGLLKGIEKYDPGRGCTLPTYAAWWIKQAVGREAARRWRQRAGDYVSIETDDRQLGSIFVAKTDVGADVEAGIGEKLIQEAIVNLQDAEREAVHQWLLCGENVNAAGRKLGVDEGRMRTLLHSAWSKIQHPANPTGVLGLGLDGAACNKEGLVNYFPGPGRRTRSVRCGECPVREKCLAIALEHPKLVGIWGGVGEGERKALRRRERHTP